jgi:hypothetical protein
MTLKEKIEGMIHNFQNVIRIKKCKCNPYIMSRVQILKWVLSEIEEYEKKK